MKYLINIYEFLNEAKVDDIYSKYYSDIERFIFKRIVSVDPTTTIKDGEVVKMGTYSKWLLHLYKSDRLKREDFYKATEYLTSFDALKRTNKITGRDADILKYYNLPDLFKTVSRIGGTGKPTKDESYLIEDRYYIEKGEAELFYEDNKYLVVVPRTLKASEFYAYRTQWCTQYPSMFEKYTKQGKLYVIIDKGRINSPHEHRRMQFHFESSQFMDVHDESIPTELLSQFKNMFSSVELSFIFDYDSMSPYAENRAVVSLNGKYGYVDSDGNVVVPLVYDNALGFTQGRGVVKQGKTPASPNGKTGAVDLDGNVVIPIIYDKMVAFRFNQLTLAVLNGKHGVIDLDGNTVIAFEYDYMSDFKKFHDGMLHLDFVGIKVKKDGKFGILDDTGKVCVPLKYDVLDFDKHSDLVCAQRDGKWGLVTFSDGRELTPFKYDRFNSYSSGKFTGVADGVEITISRTGKETRY